MNPHQLADLATGGVIAAIIAGLMIVDPPAVIVFIAASAIYSARRIRKR